MIHHCDSPSSECLSVIVDGPGLQPYGYKQYSLFIKVVLDMGLKAQEVALEVKRIATKKIAEEEEEEKAVEKVPKEEKAGIKPREEVTNEEEEPLLPFAPHDYHQ